MAPALPGLLTNPLALLTKSILGHMMSYNKRDENGAVWNGKLQQNIGFVFSDVA